jgi:hypothetical protein
MIVSENAFSSLSFYYAIYGQYGLVIMEIQSTFIYKIPLSWNKNSPKKQEHHYH